MLGKYYVRPDTASGSDPRESALDQYVHWLAALGLESSAGLRRRAVWKEEKSYGLGLIPSSELCSQTNVSPPIFPVA